MTDEKLKQAQELQKEINELKDLMRFYLNDRFLTLYTRRKAKTAKWKLGSKWSSRSATSEIFLPKCVLIELQDCIRKRINEPEKEYEAL